jgi:hypothetical protein
MASPSTPRGQALPEQREAGERLRRKWLPYESRCRGSRPPIPWPGVLEARSAALQDARPNVHPPPVRGAGAREL